MSNSLEINGAAITAFEFGSFEAKKPSHKTMDGGNATDKHTTQQKILDIAQQIDHLFCALRGGSLYRHYRLCQMVFFKRTDCGIRLNILPLIDFTYEVYFRNRNTSRFNQMKLIVWATVFATNCKWLTAMCIRRTYCAANGQCTLYTQSYTFVKQQ